MTGRDKLMTDGQVRGGGELYMHTLPGTKRKVHQISKRLVEKFFV